MDLKFSHQKQNYHKCHQRNTRQCENKLRVFTHFITGTERFVQAYNNSQTDYYSKKCKNLNVDTPFGIDEYGGYKRTVNSVFQECSNVEKRLVETTVVQYHHFMNHGEFKVSFGVVNGHSAILNHNYLYQQIETDNAEYQYIIIVA